MAASWLGYMKQTYGLPLLALVAMGYWLQGFRCFPWLAVSYYLKDNLKVDSGTLQFLQQTSSLPFLAKPIYGLISDSVYLRGAHRVPYLVMAGLLQALSWGTIIYFPVVSTSVNILTLYLTLSNLGVAIGEVANDAIIAEFGKQGGSTSELQSFAWLAFSSGALLGNLCAGLALSRIQTLTIFTIFFTVVAGYFIAASLIDEKSLVVAPRSTEAVAKFDEDDKAVKGSQSIKEVVKLLQNRPDILRPIVWFTVSVSIIPSLLGSVFFYQTEVLKINSFYLGLSKTVGQVGLLFGSMIYNKWLKNQPFRRLVAGIQALVAASMLFDLVVINGLNSKLGVPDQIFVVAFSGFMEAVGQFKILPFMVAISKQCPPGTEGTILAIFAACVCLAAIVSGYFGVFLASLLGISSGDFSRLGIGILIEAALALSPAFFTSYLPEVKHEVKRD